MATRSGRNTTDPEETTSEDRLTMTEAARLKGVSYHTVSRAVRSGRLPATRLGRMALIATDDLETWTPMRDRAPRRYRRTPAASDQTASPVSLIASGHVDLANQLAALHDVVHSSADGDNLKRLAQIAVERIAETFALARMSVWRFDWDNRSAERLALYREPISSLPSHVSLDDVSFLEKLAADTHARVLSIPDAFPDIMTNTTFLAPDGPLLVVPLTCRNQIVGIMFGDRDGHEIGLAGPQLNLARTIAGHLGMAIENVIERERDKRQRSQLEMILGELSSAVAAFDADGHLTLANSAERMLFDLSDDEVKPGQHATAYVRHKQIESMDGAPLAPSAYPIIRALEGYTTRDVNHIAVHKDGSRRCIRVNARPMEVGGEILGAISISEDITAESEAHDRAEERLDRLEREVQRSQALADLMVEMTAGHGAHAVAGIALEQLVVDLGARSGVMLIRIENGRYDIGAVFGEPQSIALADLRATVETNPTSGAFAQYRPILVPADVLGSFGPDLDASKSVLIVPMQIRGVRIGVAYLTLDKNLALDEGDLSFAAIWGHQCALAIDKAILADQLAFAHGRLMAILDQLVQAVVIVDAPDGQITMSNQAAERLWGMPLDDDHLVASALPVIDDEGIPLEGDEHPLMRPLRTHQERVGEPLTVIRNDGARVDVLASHSPIFDTRGEVVGSVSVLQDRADFKPLDRAKDEFISVVAHELRNPLTSLRGNLQLMQRRFRKRADDASMQDVERMDSVITQVDRINELVGRMLDVSRADMGRLDVTTEPCDAVAIVKAVVTEAKGLDPGRRFVLDMPESLPVVWDGARVEQVLRNLMQNAARYAPGSEVAIVVATTPTGHVVISVRDHGPGVPDSIRRRLFTQYYRFDDGQEQRGYDSHGHRGLGIGLYVSARLARAHHGSLTVENVPDGGARFTLDLPRDGSCPAPEPCDSDTD